MKLTLKKNDGVSPVMVITLLLAIIAVVLIAIIAVVVIGMAGDVDNSHDVSYVDNSPDVSYVGNSLVIGVNIAQGPASNAGSASLLVTITGGDVAKLKTLYLYDGSVMVAATPALPSKIVAGVPYKYVLTPGRHSISVVGQFSDGAQTIYTGNINLV